MELYAEIRSRIEGRAVSPSEGQAVLRNLYVAPTMEAARAEAEEAILAAFIYNDPFRGREVFTNPGEELQPGTKLDWEFLEPRNLLVGPPEHVTERVHELAEVCGLEYLLVEHAHAGIPQRLILRNLELFATKVMPAFRETSGTSPHAAGSPSAAGR
jgi:alkanesulfonate monooxygenase SsuD/methylene tetrahydromethanopterin reductase-like flavin-dependent oxidoreductase (luciferase family)